MRSDLDNFRKQIDALDNALIEIIQKRIKLVHKIGKLKSQSGIAVCDPKREQQMIQTMRKRAIEYDLSPELIEDILRRLMRESYVNESQMGFQKIHPDCGTIVIIGGRGKMGTVFANAFERSGYSLLLLDKEDDISDSRHFLRAALVLITVPIHKTEDVIEQLPELPYDCILADLTSIKNKPLLKMLAKHSGPVLGLHPMFGPSTPSMVRQTIVQCNGRNEESYQWLLDQIRLWGADIVVSDALEHDKQMALIQALRHFTSFVYGFFLMQEGSKIEELLLFSSPIYRLELSLVGRLFAQSPELYADIILSSTYNIDLITRYEHTLELLTDILKHKDEKHFLRLFEKVSQYFSPQAKFLMESTDHLLELSIKQREKK